MKSYIICPPKYASIAYGLYELTHNGTYTIAKAFSGRDDKKNVQALLDLLCKTEGKFQLEVR